MELELLSDECAVAFGDEKLLLSLFNLLFPAAGIECAWSHSPKLFILLCSESLFWALLWIPAHLRHESLVKVLEDLWVQRPAALTLPHACIHSFSPSLVLLPSPPYSQASSDFFHFSLVFKWLACNLWIGRRRYFQMSVTGSEAADYSWSNCRTGLIIKTSAAELLQIILIGDSQICERMRELSTVGRRF